MKRILVTGAGGFLGTHLVESLVKQNDCSYIYCTDISKTVLTSRYNSYDWYNTFKSRITILSTEEVMNYNFEVENIKYVINCAFPRNVKGTEFVEGLLYVKQIIRKSSEYKETSFINISSQSLYNSYRDKPAKETDSLCLDSPYCVGKFMSEELCDTYFTSNHQRYTNIRMASLIGPGFDQRVVNKMIDYALENGVISIVENNQQFGFVDIVDAVNGIISFINTDKENCWDPYYNLGSEKTYSLLEIANEVKQVLNDEYGKSNISINIKDCNDLYLNSSLDGTKLYKLTNFECSTSLSESIKKIASYKLTMRGV